MAGLESIALAVAQLEAAGKHEVKDCPDDGHLTSCPRIVDPVLKARLLPTRTAFDEFTARRVSSDSFCESSTTSPVSSDMVSFSLESFSEQEYTGPPPAPPPPSDVITEVMESDVLCGRGGETNHHPGNVKYRLLVKQFQPLYIISKRRDKPRIAEKIVHTIRHRGGRFLKKDSNSLTWKDVGNTKAREKTSQALREGAPELRTTPKVKEDIPAESSGVIVSNHPTHSHSHSHPSIVERQPGDIPISSPMKRPRLEGFETTHVPQVLMATGLVLSPPALTMQTKPHFISPKPISPNSFAATVSADDEDDRSDERFPRVPEERQPMSARGPRLKLLKKRLQNDEKP